jgi:hypothetical protein
MAADTLKIDTGNEELDKKVEQWLHWDKVRKISIKLNFHEYQ